MSKEKEKDIRGVPLMMKIPVYYSWDDETSQYVISFDCMHDFFSDEMKKLEAEMSVLTNEVINIKKQKGLTTMSILSMYFRIMSKVNNFEIQEKWLN